MLKVVFSLFKLITFSLSLSLITSLAWSAEEGPYSFTTSDLIYENLVENGKSYQGPFSSYLLPPFDPNRYVRSFLGQTGPLNSTYGVLGSFSNLGPFGLFGNSFLNPEQVFKAMKNWEDYSVRMGKLAGATSSYGPNSQILAQTTMEQMAAWMPAMNTADGPLAELGALFHQGILSGAGPNGPGGIWGFDSSEEGAFRDQNGFLVRESREVDIDGENRRVRLYEIYDQDQAKKLSEIPGYHDLHFGVRGAFDKPGAKFQIPVTPRKERWVSIMVLPKRPGDRFRLRILDKKGKPVEGLSAGNHKNMSAFIRLEIPAEREVLVEVEYIESVNQAFFTPWHIYLDSIFQFWSQEEYKSSQAQFGLFVSGAPLNAPVGGKEQFYLRHYEPKKIFRAQEAFSKKNKTCEYIFM